MGSIFLEDTIVDGLEANFEWERVDASRDFHGISGAVIFGKPAEDGPEVPCICLKTFHHDPRKHVTQALCIEPHRKPGFTRVSGYVDNTAGFDVLLNVGFDQLATALGSPEFKGCGASSVWEAIRETADRDSENYHGDFGQNRDETNAKTLRLSKPLKLEWIE